MSDRRFDREIVSLAGPALVSLLAEPAHLLVDTAVVGHLGTESLAGLAVASSILLGGFSLCIFLAYGTTGAVSRLLGAGRRGEAATEAVQGCWLALVIGIVLAGAAAAAAEAMVSGLGATGAVAQEALVYLRVSLPGFPFLLVGLAGTGYLRGLKDTRTPLIVALGAAVLNIAGDLLLVVGLGLGIGASAASTVLAQVATAAVLLSAVVLSARSVGATLVPRPSAMARQLRVGVDLIVRTAALRGSLIGLTAIAARLGEAPVAAHQVVAEVANTMAMALDALAIAAQAMVGHLLGAGELDSARALARRLVALGLWVSVAMAVGLAMVRPVLPAVFTDDPEVADLVGFLLLALAVTLPPSAVAYVLDGVLIGAGDQRFLAWAMVAAAGALVVVAAPILPLGLGIGWVWAAFGALMVARAALLLGRLFSDRWLTPGPTR